MALRAGSPRAVSGGSLLISRSGLGRESESSQSEGESESLSRPPRSRVNREERTHVCGVQGGKALCKG